MSSATDAEIRAAVATLSAGGVIGLPTETVYGLAADAESPPAVARIFEIKGRPAGHPLIVHLGDASWLPRYVREVPESAARLAKRFWPGPLTLVLWRNARVPDAVTGGLDTVALRVPKHPVARRVLLELGRPLAAPSANRFGAVSPTTRAHVLRDLGDAVPLVLDGGPADVGLESTIVDLTRTVPRLLRPGAVTRRDLEGCLHGPVLDDDGTGPAAPGTLASHYAPHAQVVLVSASTLWDEARARRAAGKVVGVIAAGTDAANAADADAAEHGLEGVVDYLMSTDPEAAARELYGALRYLDERGVDVILTVLPPPEGIGEAVGDRLRRAAAPRA